MEKAFSGRFGFDDSRIYTFRTICQEQSNGNAPWGVYMTVPIGFISYRGLIYSSAWGFRTLLTSTNWARAKAFES